jgi:hypothetical protein
MSLWRKKLGPLLLARRWTRGSALKSRLRQQTKMASRDGRGSFYSEDQLAKRSALRQDPAVLDALHMWWSAALVTKDAAEDGRLAKLAYLAIQRKIYKVLSEEFDEKDALDCAEEDWTRDVQGLDFMGRESFTDGLFECVLAFPCALLVLLCPRLRCSPPQFYCL